MGKQTKDTNVKKRETTTSESTEQVEIQSTTNKKTAQMINNYIRFMEWETKKNSLYPKEDLNFA